MSTDNPKVAVRPHGEIEAAISAELFSQFRKERNAFVQGDPANGQMTLIDGKFDLRAIARNLLRRLENRPDRQPNSF